MNTQKKYLRLLAVALCLATALCFAVPAMAVTVVAYSIVAADNTPVYSDENKTTAIGYFNKGDIVGVVGKTTAKSVYQITQSAAATSTCWISMSAVSNPAGKKSSDVVATMKSSTGTEVTTTGTSTTTGGSAGYITNCKSYVNWRATASTSAASLGTLSLNAVITVYEKTNGFYKITYNGTTGYVSDKYVKLGTPSSSSGSSSTSSGSTGTVSNCKTSVNWRATASTSGKVLGKLKKGVKVTVLGSEGDFYKISYSGKTGYISKAYLTVSGGSSSGGTNKEATFSKLRIEANKSKPSATIQAAYDAAIKLNKDVIGYISITNTNIKFPILYREGDVNYYDKHDEEGKAADKGAVHSFYNITSRNNVVTAHNMRKSNDMFHQLSHIFDKTTGKTTCQTGDYKCPASNLNAIPDMKVANRTMDIYAFGYTRWELWAMYKTEASEPTDTINNNINHLGYHTEAQIKTWIADQQKRSVITSNSTVYPDDVFLTLYTCGTNYDYETAQSRIYLFLKAVQ